MAAPDQAVSAAARAGVAAAAERRGRRQGDVLPGDRRAPGVAGRGRGAVRPPAQGRRRAAVSRNHERHRSGAAAATPCRSSSPRRWPRVATRTRSPAFASISGRPRTPSTATSRSRSTPRAGRPRRWRAMLDLFASNDRIPRLEFFAELWPDLGPALDAAGLSTWTVRAQVMARHRDDRPSALVGDGAMLLDAHDAPRRCSGRSWQPRRRCSATPGCWLRTRSTGLPPGLARGRIAVAAAAIGAGAVAGASLIRAGTVAELVGRLDPAGLAAARARSCAVASSCWTASSPTGGELVWLSAGDAASAALYRRAGLSALRHPAQLCVAGHSLT